MLEFPFLWRPSNCRQPINCKGRGKIKNERGNPVIRECGAKAKTNNHQPCRRTAMANGRCRLHGGLVPKHNTGPKTKEGKLRQKMANWKHGMCSKEALEERRILAKLLRESKDLLSIS